MRRYWTGWCWLIAFAVATGVQASDAPSFDLSFDAPAEIRGEAGGTAAGEVAVVLNTRDAPDGAVGAQGYSLSVAATEGCAIVGATVDGTAAADLGALESGFVNVELVPGGAVAVVVLSLEAPVTLAPSDGPHTVLALTVEGSVPTEEQCCNECELQFADGLQGGGEPIDNAVTYVQQTILPTTEPARLRFGQIVPFALYVDAPEVAHVVPGTPSVTIDPSVRLSCDIDGAQGWSFSLVSEGACEFVAATTDGTAGAESALDPEGLSEGGFQKTEIVLPGDNGGRNGVVSAVVLSFTLPTTLVVGDYEVLAMSTSCDTAGLADGDTAAHELSFPPNIRQGGVPPETGPLTGSGQPVKTAVTFGGSTVLPDRLGATMILRGREPQIASFLRCDSNGDGEIDIADAIWTVNALFLGGPVSLCADAADCNDDEFVDISDSLFTVTYQFMGGDAPPAPYPECGLDDDVTELSCPDGSTICP